MDKKRVCEGLPDGLVVPSAHIYFDDDSIREGCLSLDVYLFSMDGFLYTIPNPSIALQFSEPATSGIVVNQNDASVGDIAGDGVSITFHTPTPNGKAKQAPFYEILRDFTLCMLPRPSKDKYNDGWEKDFAIVVEGDRLKMLVLNMNVEETKINGYTFWCAKVDNMEDLVRMVSETGERDPLFFPVWKEEDSDDKEVYSERSIALAYTLGACFLAVFVFYFLLLARNLATLRTMLGALVPTLFLLLATFRAIFFFLWAEYVLVDEEVVEYILFETPTFVLMVLLLVFIHCWKNISQKNEKKYVVEFVLFIFIVLIYIAIIIAAILLVENEEETDSPCPGRAPAEDSGLEDNLRILSLSYMSVVTALTYLLAGMMIYESRSVIRMMTKGFFGAMFYVPASRFTFIFLFFFIVRCTILLVIYAIQYTSDIFIFVLLFVCEVVPCCILWLEITFASLGHSSEESNLRSSNKKTSSQT